MMILSLRVKIKRKKLSQVSVDVVRNEDSIDDDANG
jgi:hypothetical protein